MVNIIVFLDTNYFNYNTSKLFYNKYFFIKHTYQVYAKCPNSHIPLL